MRPRRRILRFDGRGPIAAHDPLRRPQLTGAMGGGSPGSFGGANDDGGDGGGGEYGGGAGGTYGAGANGAAPAPAAAGVLRPH